LPVKTGVREIAGNALDFARKGGRTAAPLTVASWGGYYLPKFLAYPPPFGALAPWVAFLAIAVGGLAACYVTAQEALKKQPR